MYPGGFIIYDTFFLPLGRLHLPLDPHILEFSQSVNY